MSELAAVTAYFNPEGFETKRSNFDRFRAGLARQGIPVVVVECAFGDAAFDLPAGAADLRVRARSPMWQKERLLNLAVSTLPASYGKVAWLDCDLLFENDSWVDQAAAALESHAVLQLFERVVRLPRGAETDDGTGQRWDGFAAVFERDHELATTSWFNGHGHSGFAWAARRELWDGAGLYDTALSGCGDHLMAHALVGDLESRCVLRALGGGGPQLRRLRRWAAEAASVAGKEVGHVPGSVWHLWHGDLADRRYDQRAHELAALGFDPDTDLRHGPDGCWEWATEKPDLHKWARNYFAGRAEDGRLAEASAEVRPRAALA
jgi:hypothetical protein